MSKVRHPLLRRQPLQLAYVNGGLATYRPGELFGPRALMDYEFVWIISGGAVYYQDDRPYDAPAGTVILARPGVRERYDWDPKRTTRHAFFHFDARSMPADWPPPAHWPVLRAVSGFDVIPALFRYVVDRWCLAHPRGPAPREIERMVEALLTAFLADASPRDTKTAVTHPEPVRRALAWIAHHLTTRLDQPVTLDDLATAAAVSPKHLCRLFSSSLHATPMETVRLLRLEQAVALLWRSNLNVKQIAARCGFASPYHFSRSFTKAYGSPPREVRKQVVAGGPPPPGPLAAELPRLEQW